MFEVQGPTIMFNGNSGEVTALVSLQHSANQHWRKGEEGEGEEGFGCVLLLISSDNSFLPESSGNVILYISLLCVQFCLPMNVHSLHEM